MTISGFKKENNLIGMEDSIRSCYKNEGGERVMKTKEKKESRNLWLRGMAVSVWLMAMLLFGYTAKLIPAAEVQAADTKVTTISFTDKSGSYLQKINGKWYLKDSNGKALTGVQALRIKKTACGDDGKLPGHMVRLCKESEDGRRCKPE